MGASSKLAACIAAAALLSGCDLSGGVRPWSSADAKINAAFPLSEALRNNSASLKEAATGEQKKEITDRLQGRLKLRALNCAQGYTPSWFESQDTIRRKLGTTPCFAEADSELVRWTGFLRAGIVLARPPLKQPPKTSPASIAVDGFISAATFSSEAPFVLLRVGQTIQIVDMETSRTLFREATTSGSIGELSPNGRLFIVGEGNQMRIRESETGAVVAEIPSARSFTFRWLDARTAVYNRSEGGDKTFLIDFVSGKEVPVTFLRNGAERGAPVPGADDQYVLVAGPSITKIKLDRSGIEPTLSLVADQQSSSSSWTLNGSGSTADGARYFGHNSSELKVVNLTTLEVDLAAFEPLIVQLAFPTPDPDKVIVSGFAVQGEGPRALLYSIGKRTIELVDTAKVNSERFVYVPSLRKQGVIADSRIVLFDALPTQQEITLAKFTADMQEVVNQRKLAAFEKQQQALAAAPAQNPPLGDLARDAQIEAIGVYQGMGTTQGSSGRTGFVSVRVARSAKPIVLVLSSYEGVRWTISPDPGARIAAVLVSGYNPSQVIGAGSARVVNIGGAYAYKAESPQYNALNRDVARMVGKGIGLFQGRYEGGQFSVGGS